MWGQRVKNQEPRIKNQDFGRRDERLETGTA